MGVKIVFIPPLIAAGLISGGVGIASGLLDHLSGRRAARKEREARMKMAKFGYGKDLEMWQRQNVYNMPSAQMARLKQAGLNPNLIYGQGSVAGNTGSQMPKYNQPQLDYKYQPPNIAENLQKYSNFTMQQAQTKNIDADTVSKLVEAKINLETVKEQVWGKKEEEEIKAWKRGEQELRTTKEAAKEPYYRDMAKLELSKYQGSTKEAIQSANLKELQVQLYKILKGFGIGAAAIGGVGGLVRLLSGGKGRAVSKIARKGLKSKKIKRVLKRVPEMVKGVDY